jgi:hypothetical protein
MQKKKKKKDMADEGDEVKVHLSINHQAFHATQFGGHHVRAQRLM